MAGPKTGLTYEGLAWLTASENAAGLHRSQVTPRLPGLSRSVPVGGKPTGEFTDISTRLASESCTDPLLGNDSGITRMSEGRSGCKGPPTLGYFHQDCWNNLGFSDILAACLNRSLVREIDDRSWPKPPNAFRTGETGHPIGTPHGVNPTAQPNRGSKRLFGGDQARKSRLVGADNCESHEWVRKKPRFKA